MVCAVLTQCLSVFLPCLSVSCCCACAVLVPAHAHSSQELKSELESMQKLKKEPGPVEEDGDPAVAPEEGGDRDYKPHGLAQREAQGAYSRRSKRIMKEVRDSVLAYVSQNASVGFLHLR